MRTKRLAPSFPWALALVGLAIFSTGCGSKSSGTPTASVDAAAPAASGEGGPSDVSHIPAVTAPARPAANLHPTVSIKTSLGNITVKLDAEKAPVTVENFLDNYVSRGFYQETVFHYVDKKMVLGGGFTATLKAKDARAPIRSEAANGLKNVRGTIAMARMAEFPDTATSQFFFNVTDNSNFDHQEDDAAKFGYCVFGEVVEGLDVLDQIAATQVQTQGDFVNTPVKPILIQSVTRID